MIGLDTNVLVRFLTNDDLAQAAKAAQIIEKAGSGSLFISSIVLCEMVWVLEGAYNRKRQEIAEVLEKLLLASQLAFEDKELLWSSLADYRKGKGNFADYAIGRTGRRAGVENTLTFDRGLKDSALFRLL